MNAEDRELLIAQRTRELGTCKRDRDKLYDQLRRLENRVRVQAAKCMAASDEDEAQAAMLTLLRAVPVKPRPTKRQLAQQRRAAR